MTPIDERPPGPATSEPQFPSEMDCVHCEAPIALPLRKHEGRLDYVVSEDDSFTCSNCGGVNHVAIDDSDDPEAYFQNCDDAACVACAKGAA